MRTPLWWLAQALILLCLALVAGAFLVSLRCAVVDERPPRLVRMGRK